jgi:cobalt-zinc-cadmium efflux system outer membrane protein
MRQRMLLLVILCSAWQALPALAQQPMTESEVLARVSLESPRARAIRAQADLVRADALGARRLLNPSLTASREAVSGVTEQYLLLSQALPITGRRRLQIASASEEVRAADLRRDDLTRRLRADARRAFVDLSVEEARERELASALGALQSLVDVLVKRESAGDAAGFDRLRAEREALDVAATLSDTRARRARAQGQVAAFFFPAPEPSTMHAAPLSLERAPLPGAADLVARAEAARADLQALDRDIAAARLALRAAERSVIPEPQVVAGLKTSSAGSDNRGSVLSIQASIPLFDRAAPERARAEARVRLATAERDALRAEIGASVGALRLAAEERRAALDAYRRVSVPKSDELQRIAQLSYDAGERGILELLDAYRTAADARLRLLELDAATAQAEIDLELATAVEIRK